MYEVIDISKYQGDVDFTAVKAAGIYGVIIRAGYGREISQTDPYFAKNYDGAKAAGLHVGAYWYSYAVSANDARKEADVFMRVIGVRGFDLPLYLDMERRDMGAGAEVECAAAFLDVIRARRPANFVGFYSYTNYMHSIDMEEIRKHCDTVWKADYRTVPDSSIQCDMHQYTSTGRVAGISGNVDMNHLYRDFPRESNKEEYGMNTVIIGPASSGDIHIIGRYCESIGVKYVKDSEKITVRNINDGVLGQIVECVDRLGNIPYTVTNENEITAAELAAIQEKLDSIEKMLDSIEKMLADMGAKMRKVGEVLMK